MRLHSFAKGEVRQASMLTKNQRKRLLRKNEKEESEDPFSNPDNIEIAATAILRRYSDGDGDAEVMADYTAFRDRCPGLYTKICAERENFDMDRLRGMLAMTREIRAGDLSQADADTYVGTDMAEKYAPNYHCKLYIWLISRLLL